MFNIQVWLVKDEDGLILVDAGIPPMAKGILNAIEKVNAGPLKQILLTHGHPDHVGSLKIILEKNSVPLYAHMKEIPYVEGEKPYHPFKKAKVGVKPSIIVPLLEVGNDKIEDVGRLTPFFTPGHTSGHVSYYHNEDQVLIGGDLFMARSKRLRRPLSFFTSNKREAIESGSLIKRLQPELLTVTHGGEIARAYEQYDDYYKRWIIK